MRAEGGFVGGEEMEVSPKALPALAMLPLRAGFKEEEVVVVEEVGVGVAEAEGMGGVLDFLGVDMGGVGVTPPLSSRLPSPGESRPSPRFPPPSSSATAPFTPPPSLPPLPPPPPLLGSSSRASDSTSS